MGWVKGSDRNFKASQTERYRKTKKEFLTTPRTFFSKTMLDSTCKYTFSDLRYFTYTRFFDGTPRVRAPAAPRLISQLFALLHILPSWRQYLSSFVCESTHKIATFREDLVTADDNGTVRHRGMGTGISEASKRVPIFSFATQGGKQVSSHFRQGN